MTTAGNPHRYLPPLRSAHPNPAAFGIPEAKWTKEEQVYRELHDASAGAAPPGLDTRRYPSHLHIDLAPEAQGVGQGARIMAVLLDALRQHGSRGVYLQMHESNARAHRFYDDLGFRKLEGVGGADGGTGGDLYLGLEL